MRTDFQKIAEKIMNSKEFSIDEKVDLLAALSFYKAVLKEFT